MLNQNLPNEKIETSTRESNRASLRARDHLANERTFLAWIRTSIGIMAFGFVIEKFSFFLKKFADLDSKVFIPQSNLSGGLASKFGIILVAFGALVALVAFLQYYRGSKQIEKEAYRTPTLLSLALTILVALCGIFLVVYLMIDYSLL